jgi:hypothetical protein
MPFVQEGDMTVFFSDNSGNGKFVCQVVELDVALARSAVLYSASGSFGSVTETMHVPAVPLGLYVENTDTIAQNIGYFASIGNS